MRQQRFAVIVLLSLLLGSAIALAVNALPEGVSTATILSSERRNTSAVGNISAQAGNVTRLSISSVRQTGAWQGFAGNITGSIVLDDASGDRFYSWSLFNISGEIYASRNGTINFNSIYPHNNCTIDESLTGSAFADRVNRTYIRSTNTLNFSVGNIAINSSTACAAYPFVNSTTSSLFEDVILTPELNNASGVAANQSQGNQSIYANILQLSNVHGFDAQMYNFQLLVPVDRVVGFNQYFFYAELD